MSSKENNQIEVLLIEDNFDHVYMIQEMLAGIRSPVFHVESADRLSTGLERIARGGIDVVLLDLSLPDSQGVDTFIKFKNHASEIPVVVLSTLDDETTAVKAMQAGAQDYLVKGRVDGSILRRSIRYAIERKLAGEQLRKLSRAVEKSPVSIIITDADGNIEYVNPKFSQATGYSPEEVLGQNPRILKSGEQSQEFYKHLWNTIKSGKVWRGEFHNKKKSGELFWELASISPITNEENVVTHFVAVKEDITERKQNEMELARHRQYLEELVKERTTEITRTNKLLRQDISRRKQVEEALRNALTEVGELKNRLHAENVYLQNEIRTEHNFEEIICQSRGLKKVLHKIEQVASTNATVLILGETGTGKELLARAVHNLSLRNNRTLVKVNCAAIPATLIESELFGHEKGAFTGALARKIGRFELADNGTIFLDEIGDLPLDLQAKLLRVLQEGEFERLGNPRTVKIDARVIAATNRNLEKIVETGEFRRDLYYRLNVFPIKSPALRERKEDIPALVNHFIKKYNAKLGKNIQSIPQKVMDSLQVYNWPGNVRELENVIERAVILSENSTVELDDFFDRSLNLPYQEEKLTTLKKNERFLIREALEESHWVIEGKRGAALKLGLAPSTLRLRIKEYDLKKPL